MADEPGGLVIQGGVALLEGAHPERYRNAPTLRPQAPTGRGSWTF
jgi:hypothetical protein